MYQMNKWSVSRCFCSRIASVYYNLFDHFWIASTLCEKEYRNQKNYPALKRSKLNGARTHKHTISTVIGRSNLQGIYLQSNPSSDALAFILPASDEWNTENINQRNLYWKITHKIITFHHLDLPLSLDSGRSLHLLCNIERCAVNWCIWSALKWRHLSRGFFLSLQSSKFMCFKWDEIVLKGKKTATIIWNGPSWVRRSDTSGHFQSETASLIIHVPTRPGDSLHNFEIMAVLFVPIQTMSRSTKTIQQSNSLCSHIHNHTSNGCLRTLKSARMKCSMRDDTYLIMSI